MSYQSRKKKDPSKPSVHSVVSDSLRPHGLQHARFPVHHQLPEHAQTHVYQVSDVIQSSHYLSSPSPPAFNLSQHHNFSNESVLRIRWPKYWSFSFSISLSNEYSGLTSFRIDWFDPCSPRGSQESSPTPQLKSINSLALSFLYGPILTSIHDHWNNHCFDCIDLSRCTLLRRSSGWLSSA